MNRSYLIILMLCTSPLAAEDRTIDGSDNNLTNTTWGQANTTLRRIAPNAYNDGASTLARPGAPSARALSNEFSSQTGSILNDRGLSDFIWAWGQFLDHDIGLTNTLHSPAERADIPVAGDDPLFTSDIGFFRSNHTVEGGVREQINEITSFVDASGIYGSNLSDQTDKLRANDNSGKLKVQSSVNGDLLPSVADASGIDMANPTGQTDANLYGAGDVRANEMPTLTSLHTVMVREHNRVIDRLSALSTAERQQLGLPEPGETGYGEAAFQVARKVVGAEVQAVTYNEFLGALGVWVDPYTQYNENTDPSIMNEFAHAAYRFGHSMVADSLKMVNDDGTPVGSGSVTVVDAFFAPTLVQSNGIEPFLRGLATQQAQEVDAKMVDSLRNLFMNVPPHPVFFDLAAVNIQRGRDHGLPDYLTLRDLFTGLGRTTDDIPQAVIDAYGDVNMIDPWLGMISETHLPGSSIGPTLHAIFKAQFEALRDGDRFWYENDPIALDALDLLGFTLDGTTLEHTLAQILLDNTAIDGEIFGMTGESNVFFVQAMHMPEPGTYILLGLALLPAVARRKHALAV